MRIVTEDDVIDPVIDAAGNPDAGNRDAGIRDAGNRDADNPAAGNPADHAAGSSGNNAAGSPPRRVPGRSGNITIGNPIIHIGGNSLLSGSNDRASRRACNIANHFFANDGSMASRRHVSPEDLAACMAAFRSTASSNNLAACIAAYRADNMRGNQAIEILGNQDIGNREAADAAPAADPGNPDGGNPVAGTSRGTGNNEPNRHRVLYVNVGHRRHAMYQIQVPEPVDLRTERMRSAHMNLIYSSQMAPRLEYTLLVTDAAIRRFGRAENENVNYLHIGPYGAVPAQPDPHGRPNRSNLRVLSMSGFRHITNTSLTHLATAAPNLQFVDVTGTRVTEAGVEHFRNLRPECRVRYGPIEAPKEDSGRPHSR